MEMEYEYIKDFDAWNAKKKTINDHSAVAFIQPSAIWLASIGTNVGHEIDGKDNDFARPIIIIRKVSPNIFIGTPTTSKIKDEPHRFPITILGKDSQAVCTQIRSFDRKRLIRYLGKMDQEDFRKLIQITATMISYPQGETPSTTGVLGESRLPFGDDETIVADDGLNAS
jgi:mRNA interferase MazF